MTLRPPIHALVLLTAVLASGAARAACQLEKLLEMPVTMTDLRPMVSAKVNGVDAMFVADSGSFFSLITPTKAAELNLKPGPAPFGLSVGGIGGAVRKVSFVTAKSFSIAGQPLAGAFVVGGGEVGGEGAGVIGQNILGFADVEYDLGHGVIRLMRPHDCVTRSLAYWAEGQTYSTIDIEATRGRFTDGVASVNGGRIRVRFDSGASISVLASTAAKRVGVEVAGAGVVAAGTLNGVGRRSVPAWIAPVDSFKIGGEEIHHTRLRIADIDTEDFDMLVGADFLLSHHVYVANDQRKLYFTYNGGPVFNLDVAPTVQGGAALPTAAGNSAVEPVSAADFARRGTAFASRHEHDKAIADLTRAVELAPTDPTYLFERARAYEGNHQPFLAMADLDKSLALKPDDVRALTTRAALHLAGRDKPHALADLTAADRLAARQADVRLELAELYQRADEPESAVGQFDLWIATHQEDSRQATALSQRCFTRAVWDHALDLALADCDAALKREPKLVAARESRGLVRLRLGDPDAAAADFDAALAAQPKDPWALYGRGLARLKKGQTAEGKADLAAATALRPGLDAEAKAHGLAP